MLLDRYGLPLSTSSTAARDAYVAGVDCVLSAAHGDQAHLERAVEADPDFALAHAALARARFLMANVPATPWSPPPPPACSASSASAVGRAASPSRSNSSKD